MRITRTEAEMLLAQRHKVDAPYAHAQGAISARFLEQAVVATQHLTGSHEWNVFLQRIQAWVEQDKTLLHTMAESMALPNLTSEQVLQAQRHMLAARARLDAWEQVLALPKQILETGDPKAA
jgi:primosomal protein N'